MKVNSIHSVYTQKQNFKACGSDFYEALNSAVKHTSILERHFVNQKDYKNDLLSLVYPIIIDKDLIIDYNKKLRSYELYIKHRSEKPSDNLFEILQNTIKSSEDFKEKITIPDAWKKLIAKLKEVFKK